MDEETQRALKELQLFIFQHNLESIRTGSREIGGWTEESDWDIVVLWKNNAPDVADAFQENWVYGGSGRFDDTSFRSYKAGKINLIQVYDPEEFRLWSLATSVALILKPRTKAERVALFDQVFTRNRRHHIAGSNWL